MINNFGKSMLDKGSAAANSSNYLSYAFSNQLFSLSPFAPFLCSSRLFQVALFSLRHLRHSTCSYLRYRKGLAVQSDE
jgi:hypothetical protein